MYHQMYHHLFLSFHRFTKFFYRQHEHTFGIIILLGGR
nr:MAG TPA: hypothetical protein [Caudoviricetes sp.]